MKAREWRMQTRTVPLRKDLAIVETCLVAFTTPRDECGRRAKKADSVSGTSCPVRTQQGLEED